MDSFGFRPFAFCVACLISTWPCAAQSLADPARAPGQAPAQEVIDVHGIDPHAYRAVATRLPPGVEPTVDGRLDDDVWQLAPPFGAFVQREPIVGAPATERTEFRVLYDNQTLYVAIWAFEDRSRRHRRQRDAARFAAAERRLRCASYSTPSTTIGTGSTSAPTRSGR